MVKEGQLNELNYGSFKVTDDNGDPVTGLVDGDFTKIIYDPDGNDVTSTTTNDITELGNGLYKASLFPTSEGIYSYKITHSTYLPTGTVAEFEVHQDRAWLERILGLVHENIYIDNYSFTGSNMTSGRMRIYSDSSSVSTTSDVVGTYTITATYDGDENLSSFKIVKS